MSITPAMRTFRLNHLESNHLRVYNLLTAQPQSLATIAAPAGIAADEAERKLGFLVDEALVSRTVASRDKAMYTVTS